MVRSDTVSIALAACPGVIFPRARSINAEPTVRLKSSYLIPLGPATFEVIRYKEGMSDLQNMDDCLNEKISEDDKYALSGDLTLVIFNRSYETGDGSDATPVLCRQVSFSYYRKVNISIRYYTKKRQNRPNLHGFGFVLHLFTKSFTMSLVSLKKHA